MKLRTAKKRAAMNADVFPGPVVYTYVIRKIDGHSYWVFTAKPKRENAAPYPIRRVVMIDRRYQQI